MTTRNRKSNEPSLRNAIVFYRKTARGVKAKTMTAVAATKRVPMFFKASLSAMAVRVIPLARQSI